MKIIGTLDVKDEGDLLKDVLDHSVGYDAVFAYNDGSTDNTEDILKTHPRISKYVNRSDFPDSVHQEFPQHRRHHLLQMVKDEFHTYNTEEIWVVRMEGDRYLMSTTVHEICHKGDFYELAGVSGVMVDCRIGPNEDWIKLDTYPNWHKPITIIQDWGRIDDVHPVVAFRLEDGVQYSTKKPRPWPVIWGPTNYNQNDFVTKDMAFFAHHGKRGPRYWHKAFGPNGTRFPSKKWIKEWDFSSPEKAIETVSGIPFRPENLHRLRSVTSESDLAKGFSPYGGRFLDNDIANLIAYWNNIPPRHL